MKSLTYITLIAAFAFGLNVPTTSAVDNDKVSIEANNGKASASYNEASQILTLRMAVTVGQDRVLTQLSGRGGEIVFKEKSIVNQRGTVVEIPMAGLAEGTYYLRVKGSEISYSLRIKHK